VLHAQAPTRWPMQDLWVQLTLPMPLWKRALDVLISSILLILLLPLFAVIAVLIRLDSPGSPIYRQTRVGRGGRLFPFFKFRSMIGDADEQRSRLEAQNEQDGPIFKLRNDPRVTRVGRVLRRWSLDELPQLWNVFRGDISLVGPRSPTPNEVPFYERWQRRRLMVTGGLTCTWQVGGRSEIPFREWMRMDLRYIERRSMLYDFWLLAKTVPAVLTGRGAH
jgi:lipopolysaccharide/colanic/teichoic acid biosynthesis glycosyltransferase